MSKYTIRNRASVMTFDIKVDVFMKEQLENAVKWLVENDYCYEYDVDMGDSISLAKYSLRVQNMPWAKNVEEFANVLSMTDYASDDSEHVVHSL